MDKVIKADNIQFISLMGLGFAYSYIQGGRGEIRRLGRDDQDGRAETTESLQ